MRLQTNTLPTSPGGASLSWPQVWMRALTQPSVVTYEELIRDPGARPGRAYIWVVVASLIEFFVVMLGQLALVGSFGGDLQDALPMIGLLGSSVLICGAPIVAVLSLLALMISAGISQLVAGALGGIGTYSRLVYAIAAYLAPLSIITSVLGLIPFLGVCLIFPLGIYAIVLNVIAIKAVNQFDWGKAILSSAAILGMILGIAVVLAAVVILILALLGPAVGNVFSNIIETLPTPGP